MDKSWYIKGVIFLGILLGILFVILAVYFIVTKLRDICKGSSKEIEDAEEAELSNDVLLSQAVRDKILEEKTYLFETTKTYESYDEDLVNNLSPDEQIVANTLIEINLQYNEEQTALYGSLTKIVNLEPGPFSHVRYHLKVEGKKKLRFRSPLRSVDDLNVPVAFVLAPVLPRDLADKVLRIRLYGLRKRLPTLLRNERCIGEANIELARHELELRDGNMITTEHAILPLSPPFPGGEE